MRIKLPRQNKIYSRRELILKQVRNSNVLHIGCTDTPFTEERLNKGKLLHQEILNVAHRLVGIDISYEDIQIMKKNGLDDLYTLSVYDLNNFSLPKIDYDYIVLSEVLEHLPDASAALIEIREFILRNGGKAKLIVTVPNVNSYFMNLFNFLANVEQLHQDHVSYYSYITLNNIIQKSGFRVLSFVYATYGLRKVYKLLAHILNIFSSSFLPSIFVLAEIDEQVGFSKKLTNERLSRYIEK